MTLTPVELLRQNAPATRPIIALSEGNDPRITKGAINAQREGRAVLKYTLSRRV